MKWPSLVAKNEEKKFGRIDSRWPLLFVVLYPRFCAVQLTVFSQNVFTKYSFYIDSLFADSIFAGIAYQNVSTANNEGDLFCNTLNQKLDNCNTVNRH